MSLVLKNGRAFIDGRLQSCDILIEGAIIQKIGHDLVGDQEEDIRGNIVLPGFIDAHVHFREPGHPHKEDFLSGSKAAAAGGVTTVLDMPNNSPPTINQETIDNKKKLAQKSIVNYGLYLGATSSTIHEIDDVRDAIAIKVYRGSSTGGLLMHNISDFVKLLEHTDKLVVVHAEQEDLINYFSAKHKSTKMHHLMRDNLAAVLSTAESVLTTQYHKKRLHIAHLSTKEEIAFLRSFKTPAISCEACPHHLFKNSSFFVAHGNYGKMNPPLRSEEDRKELWNALKEGLIDIIATDHAPHTRTEKELSFEEAPCGVPGVQTMMPLLLNEVNQGTLSLQRVIKLCSENPAAIFNIQQRGFIREGYFADLAVVDMHHEDIITHEQQYSKSGWTPFHGTPVRGWPVMTLVNGNIVYHQGIFDETKKGWLITHDD